MNANDRSHLHSSITLMKELKDLVKSEAYALFGPKYPTSHTFDVVFSKKHSGNSAESEASLIIYTRKAPAHLYGEWVVLALNPRLCESPVDAMTDLLEELYGQVGEVMEKIDRRGGVYDGEGEIP